MKNKVFDIIDAWCNHEVNGRFFMPTYRNPEIFELHTS